MGGIGGVSIINTDKASPQDKTVTFSKLVMAGIMLMFFVGVGLGVYVTIVRFEPLSTTLDYIMQLAKIVSLGYFVKAFGENIAKIVLSAVFSTRFPNSNNHEAETSNG